MDLYCTYAWVRCGHRLNVHVRAHRPSMAIPTIISWSAKLSKLVLTRSIFKMSTYTVETIVRGYHVYRAVWEAAIGQVLPCKQERGNVHDPYTAASSRHVLYATPHNACHAPLSCHAPKFHGEHSRWWSKIREIRKSFLPRKFPVIPYVIKLF